MPVPKLSRKKIIILIIIFIIIVLVSVFLFLSRIKVEALEVKKSDAIKGVTVTGTVESLQDVSLSASVTAKIRQLLFQEGDFVTQGQVLAYLDSQEAAGQVAAASGQLETTVFNVEDLLTEPRIQQVGIAEAQIVETQQNISAQEQQLATSRIALRDAESNQQRLCQLYQQGAVSFRECETATFARQQAERQVNISRDEIQAARARLAQQRQNLSLIQAGTKEPRIQAARGQVQAARGNLDSAQGNLEDYILRAPFSGYIVDSILDKGAVVSPNSPVLRLVEQDSIYISAQVEETELNRVRPGQEALIIFDAYPENTFKGSIIEVSKDVDPVTGTFDAKVRIPQIRQRPIIVGMTTDTTIILSKLRKAIIIPEEYTSIVDKQRIVYKKVGNKAQKAYIEGQKFDNNRFIVTKGLKQGDIIVHGAEGKKVSDGNRIKITGYYREQQ